MLLSLYKFQIPTFPMQNILSFACWALPTCCAFTGMLNKSAAMGECKANNEISASMAVPHRLFFVLLLGRHIPWPFLELGQKQGERLLLAKGPKIGFTRCECRAIQFCGRLGNVTHFSLAVSCSSKLAYPIFTPVLQPKVCQAVLCLTLLTNIKLN